MMQKKSQAAIFMLMGLVILLAFIFLHYYDGIEIGEAEIVQPELIPLKAYIESCLEDTARNGLSLIGLNGGYITFPEEIAKNPKSHLPSVIERIRQPYWWYEGISSTPTEGSMELQLSAYVEKEFNSCIENYKSENSQFEISEIEKAKAKVTINENDVSFEVDYPLNVVYRANSTDSKISKFRSVVPIRLKKVYGLAKDIMAAENRDFFIEKKTIDLMSMDQKIPTSGIDVQCSQKSWYLPNIMKRLKEMLSVNLPYIAVEGTLFDDSMYVPTPYGDTYRQSYYNYHYRWKIADKTYPGMRAAFVYDEKWPLEIFARPSNNGILQSNAEKGASELSFFCLQIWHFTYDINYPVKVAITDEQTDEHDSYLFNFAFKTSIDHNYPNRVNFAKSVYDQPPVENSEQYCSDLSKEMAIYTVDSETGDDLSGVNLSFTCGRFKCKMGTSEWLSYGAAAGITKSFPYCALGLLKGTRVGYADSQQFIQSDTEGKSYTLYLTPQKEITNYSVVKHLSSNSAAEVSLGKNEQATIIIERNGIKSYIPYPAEQETPVKFYAKNDFSYNLTIYLMKDDKIIGGYKGEWKIPWKLLKDSKEIKFHVIESSSADETEVYSFIAGLESYSKSIPAPELK